MKQLSQYIEHTYLKPDFTDQTLYKLIEEAEQHQFFGICIPPFWVKKARREIGKKNIALITVAGFPFGYNMTETKMEEIKLALKDGADEIDLVWNFSAYRARMNWPKVEIAKAAQVIHENEKLLKVIIETAYLSNSEIVAASELCASAGADFIKTSTGYAPEGAVSEKVALIKKAIPPQVRIKASGGIKTKDQAIALIEAGADRIGTSSSVSLVSASKI